MATTTLPAGIPTGTSAVPSPSSTSESGGSSTSSSPLLFFVALGFVSSPDKRLPRSDLFSPSPRLSYLPSFAVDQGALSFEYCEFSADCVCRVYYLQIY